MSSLKKKSSWRNESGFSLIDVVVTVAIIVALSVGGFVAYTGLIDNAKRAAVSAAADQVYTAVAVAESSALTTPAKIKADYENSTSEITVDISGSGSSLIVIATHVENPSIKAVRGSDAGTPPATVPGPITVARTNLIPNPSFEESNAGWSNYGSGVSRTVDSSRALFGSQSIRITHSATTVMGIAISGAAQRIPVIPGENFAYSFYVSANGQSRVSATVVGLDSAGISKGVVGSVASADVGSDWSRLSVSSTVPEGVSFLELRASTVGSAPANLVLWVDGAMLESGTLEVGPYFDGSTLQQSIDGVTYSYGWTGAPNGSSSQATYRPSIATS